ncbi:MAG TPA: winged helix-turn-helix domain-containing protein, partial [Roseateles sp.]|nr:winged helix-turn-helix domain-containing protein [Roseateles sp.]
MNPEPASPSGAVELRFGPFLLQPARRRLLRDGTPVPLGARELALLLALAERPGQVQDKRALMAQAWPGTVVEEGSLRVHISNLRRSLGESAGQRWIENIPGRGYQFIAPVTPPAEAAAVPGTALPLRLRPMLGRAAELQAVLERAAGQRLLTLTGPGGIGKTTLACAAAERLAADLGAHCFVDLAPLTDPALLPAAVAMALGLLVPDAPLARLLAYLHERALLLVLDNCEHVIDAAAGLAEALLQGAPRLRILATSREPLRIQGEAVQRLTPLPAPPPEAALEQALQYPALALFVDCAQAQMQEFRPTAAELPLLVGLCERLEGNPLAIELAAAKVAAFGLPELAALLQRRLSLLGPGPRTAPARQQSLQATLAWSYETLAPAEQRLLRRLAQFRGRFTLAAALAVTAGEPLTAEQVIAGLASLVAKSLLSPHAGGSDPQFRLLASTREFALARLHHSGEDAALARRHAEHLLSVMEAAQEADRQASPAAWRAAHEQDIADLRAALDWAAGPGGDAGLAVALSGASAPLWFHLGLLQEYLPRLRQAQALAAGLPEDALQGLRLALAEGHARLQIEGPGEPGAVALGRALALARAQARPSDQLRALWSLFTLQVMRADYAAALGFAEDFARLATELGDAQAELAAHRLLALSLHMRGAQPQACALARRALEPGPAQLRFLHGSIHQLDHQAAAQATLARILWLQG